MSLFQTISERLRALFVADVALDLEAQLLSRQADRQVELLVQADAHERHGYPAVASGLRRQAEALSLARPLAGVLPALEHWQADDRAAGPDTMSSTVVPPTNGNRAARALAAKRKDR